MQSALTPLIRFIFRNLFSVLVIAVILAGGRFLLEEGQMLRASSNDLKTLTSAHASVEAYRDKMTTLVSARMAQAQNESLQQIEMRIADVRGKQDKYAATRDNSVFSFPLVGPDKFAERVSARFESAVMAELMGQELAYLQKLKDTLEASWMTDKKALEKSKVAYEQAREALLRRVDEFTRLGRLDASRTPEQAAYKVARSAYEAQSKVRTQVERPPFLLNRQALDAATKELTGRLDQARTAVTSNWFARYVSPVIHLLPLAMAVLLSSFAAHLFIKLLFYYVLAPLAARRKPIQLEAAPAVQSVRASPSAVSQDIRLAPGEELLILPEFLQSSSTAAAKDTKWLLDWSCPWTSIISGMVMLTRVRTEPR